MVQTKWLSYLLTLVIVTFSITSQAATRSISFIGPTGSWGPELQEAFDLFTAETGIEVESIQVTDWPQMVDKVVAMSLGGAPPDVIYGDNVRIVDFASQSLLANVDELIARDHLNMKVYPAPVIDGLRYNGNLYSMPTAVSIYANFFNMDMFDKSGLPPLPTDWQGPALGWDEFVVMSKKLTQDPDGDGTPNQWGLAGFGWRGGFNMLGMWGANDLSADGKTYLGTDPKVIRALTKTMSLWLEHNVVGGSYIGGTSAMWPRQTFYLNYMRQQEEKGGGFNWGVGILPNGDKRVAQASFHSIGIAAKTKSIDEAWQLVKFLSYDPEGALLFSRAENRTPVLRETVQDYILRWSQAVSSSNPQVFTDAVNVLWPWNILNGKGATEISKMMTLAFTQIRNRQASITEAMESMAPQIQAILDER